MKKVGIIVLTISLLLLAILIAGCSGTETAGEATGKKTKGILGALKTGSVSAKAKECPASTFGCEGNQPVKISYAGSKCIKAIDNVGAPCEAGYRCDAGTCIPGTPLPSEAADSPVAPVVCTPRNYTVCNETEIFDVLINVTQLADCNTRNITTRCPFGCREYPAPTGAVCLSESPSRPVCELRNHTVCEGMNVVNVIQYFNCSTENITTICPYGCLDYPRGAMCREEPRTTAEVIRSCTEGSKYGCVNSTHFLNATTNTTCHITEQNVSCIALGFERCDTATNWCV